MRPESPPPVSWPGCDCQPEVVTEKASCGHPQKEADHAG